MKFTPAIYVIFENVTQTSNSKAKNFDITHFVMHASANPWFVELEGRSDHYRGQNAVTEDGVVCQRWDAQIPYVHRYTVPILFPDATVEEAGNYCRRLDERWPWCYTTSSWDWCGKLELICSVCKYVFEFKCSKLYFRTSASTELL